MSELTPYIAVTDARAAIEWYCGVFDATVTVEPMEMPDGRIGHAEFDIGGARVMMADAHPELQCPAPTLGAGSPVTLHLTVADVDAAIERARAVGGLVDREPSDNPGVGRVAVMRDPFGHRWFLNQVDRAGD
ncbi:UNVERIFIED_CONTAM: VOC family protein [Microbacterium sp. SLM126]